MFDRKNIEILAPCGSMEALDAAISAGADACYLAGNSFGARAYAKNFDAEALSLAVEKAHEYARRIYVTVNTLTKNDEFETLYPYLCHLSEIGVDALLIQDLGVVKFVRENFPEIPIHSSTQMNVMTKEAARLMKAEGFERVVAAREMSIKDLADIKANVPVEVEAFVHGAMCFCYSGRCYYSSFHGGRSGNRGRCAQPCRQKYDGSYKMSMKDMCSLQYVPDLIEAGVDSLKIEGRMKNGYYVAATVEAYRKMIEDYAEGTFTKEKAGIYEKRLADIFNRGGFSADYLVGDLNTKKRGNLIFPDKPGTIGLEIGKVKSVNKGSLDVKLTEDLHKGDTLQIDAGAELVQITSGLKEKKGSFVTLNAPKTNILRAGNPVRRMRNAAMQMELDEKYLNSLPKISVDMEVKLALGQPLTMKAWETGNVRSKVTLTGEIASFAEKRPVGDDDIRKSVSKLGDTEFILNNLVIDNDDQCFLRMGHVNALRRDVMEALRKKLASTNRRYPLTHHDEEAPCDMVKLDKESAELQGNPIYENFNFENTALISVSTRKQADICLDFLKGLDAKENCGLILDLGLGTMSLEDIKDIIQLSKSSKIALYAGLPYIRKKISSKLIEDIIQTGIKKLMVRNIDDFASLKNAYEDGKIEKLQELLLGDSLYAYNNKAASWFFDRASIFADKVSFLAGLELTKEELEAISYPSGAKKYFLSYGRVPLMITDALDIGDKPYVMKSDLKERVPVFPNGLLCYNVILSEKSVFIRENLNGFSKMLAFTIETAEQVKEVLDSSFAQNSNEKAKLSIPTFRGHFDLGIL